MFTQAFLAALTAPPFTLNQVFRRMTKSAVTYRRMCKNLAEEIAQPATQARLATSVSETATHYAWRLCEDDDSGGSLWLNEYKSPAMRTSGYALSFHDHRYDFVSLLLSGGYLYEEAPDLQAAQAAIHRTTPPLLLRAGEVVEVNRDRFHRLVSIEPDTLSLLCKLPSEKLASHSVDEKTGMVREHLAHHLRVPIVHGNLQYVVDDRSAGEVAG